MSKFNPKRIISGIPSLVSLIIILFCPIISIDSWGGVDNYNFISFLGKSGENESTTAIAIVFSVIFSLIAVIVTMFGREKRSKTAAIILNIIGLIPVMCLIILLSANSNSDMIGVGMYLYVFFNIIAVVILGISDMILNSKSKNSTINKR